MKFSEVFNSAKYVLASADYQFPYIRREFDIRGKAVKASLYISILGFGEIYLNGEKITEDLFITPYTQYNRQVPEDIPENARNTPFFEDDLQYTIAYSKFDVTNCLKEGKNAFGCIVAGGWYRSGLDKHYTYRNYGKTKMCFRLFIELENGETQEIVSDEKCRWEESFLLQSGMFHEEQDERKDKQNFSDVEYDDSLWDYCLTAEAPEAEYRLNECPADKIIKWIQPKLLKVADGYKVYDVGENITGFPIISSTSKGNEIIVCKYAEAVTEDNELDEKHIYDQNTVFYTDKRTEHQLRFTWHGFRYFKISSTSGEVFCDKCAVVYADIKNTSYFECDNEILNWLYQAYVRTQLENYHCGVPTDCPQIERKGYTGDGQLLAKLGMMIFDSKKLYEKWMQDISDVQDRKTGFVHYTAPCFIGCGGGPGAWSCAIVTVPYVYYKQYGDSTPLLKYYPQMKKYVDFMDDICNKDGVIELTNRKEWCLGDWESPKGRDGLLPAPFVNTCLYINTLQTLVDIAKEFGFDKDAERFELRIIQLRNSVNKLYFDNETGNYCGNEQGSNAIALKAKIGDDRTLKNLVARYQELKEFDTGIFATKILIETLLEKGYPEVAYDLLTSKKGVSYYSWMAEGATTLYESWKNARSYNHPMFGSVVEQFFTHILGIRQVENSHGYQEVVINPLRFDKLNKANGRIHTEKGTICVSIEKTQELISFVVEIPENVDARFIYENYQQTLNCGKNIIELKQVGECYEEAI